MWISILYIFGYYFGYNLNNWPHRPFVSIDLQTIVHTSSVYVLMTYFNTKFHMPSSNFSLDTANKPK
jgi:hypothetical protein